MGLKIEVANRSTDKPYGITRYLVRHTTEISVMDIDNITCELPSEVIAYINSTLVQTK